jgi:hypothetical protein
VTDAVTFAVQVSKFKLDLLHADATITVTLAGATTDDIEKTAALLTTALAQKFPTSPVMLNFEHEATDLVVCSFALTCPVPGCPHKAKHARTLECHGQKCPLDAPIGATCRTVPR